MARDDCEQNESWCTRRAGGGWCPYARGGEAGRELFSSVGVVFEPCEFLPEGLHVVEWDLDGAVIDFADGVHLLLFFPCRDCLRMELDWRGVTPDLRKWM